MCWVILEELTTHTYTQPPHAQVKNGASEADIWQTIDMFKERYSDYGSDRRSAIDFHVNQLEKASGAHEHGCSTHWSGTAVVRGSANLGLCLGLCPVVLSASAAASAYQAHEAVHVDDDAPA